MFGQIQCHVILEPLITLQGGVIDEFTVMILEPRATLQGVRIPSAVLKMVFRHIFLVLFLMQFGIWRAAAFVSSRINLLYLFYVVTDGHLQSLLS